MRILVDDTLISYARAAIACGFQAFKHEPSQVSTFDTFDMANPDIYIADSNRLNKTVYKNIEERPALKVCVIQGSDEEHYNKKPFEDIFGDIHPWISDLGSADLIEYSKSEYIDRYKTDVVSIQDNPIYGIEDISLPNSIKFRIFSPSIVKSANYCGFVPNNIKKHIYKSSRVSISEGDNIYNSILCDCYPISITSDILKELNTDHSKSIKELKMKILNENTNFHQLSKVFEKLNFDKEARITLEKIKELS